MYQFRKMWVEQINMAAQFTCKSSMDSRMHWLNPLFDKCGRPLYPYRIL
jgi:hypothetical protein